MDDRKPRHPPRRPPETGLARAARGPILATVIVALLIWALLSAAGAPMSRAASANGHPAAAKSTVRKGDPRHLPGYALGPVSAAVAIQMRDASDSPDGSVYLYAEAGEGWQKGRVYDVYPDHLEARRMTRAIAMGVERLWDVPLAAQKWTSIEITVADGKFQTEFHYDEPPPPAKQSIARRADPLATKHYPGKPIVPRGKWPGAEGADEEMEELPKT